MAFPRIDKPCPYKTNLAAVMDGDFCTMCSRRVIDLTAMSATDRRHFLSSCETEVCVSYSFRPAIAAAALAAAAMALPTAAAAQMVEPVVASEAAPVDFEYEGTVIIVGGINDPKNAKLVENPLDEALPALPIVYEDDPAPALPALPTT